MVVSAGSFVPGKQYVIESLGNVLFTAGTFVPGNAYQIVSVGTTDFTLIGAANNSVGTIFTATGVGSGSGTANYITDYTLIGCSENAVGATFIATGAGTGPGTATQGSGTVSATSFGSINQGTVYYVQALINSTQLKISTVVNGSELTLTNQNGTSNLINQKDIE